MTKIILVFFFFIISFSLSANPDKDKIYTDLIKKYGTINTIEVICNQPNDNNTLQIKAKRGNKYHIKANNMEIITDGKTLWSYSPRRKTVLISYFFEDDSNISIDNIFFNVIPNMRARAVKSVLSSAKTKQYRLELFNKNKTEEIKEIYLYLDEKLTKIEGIEVISNNKNFNTKWDIKKLEINKNMPDNIFTFTTPKDVEEIDTR